MMRFLGVRPLGLVIIVLLGILAKPAVSEAQPFDPPGTHTEELGPVGWFTAMHLPGYTDPFTNCAPCHGAAMEGDIGPSCYTCHGDYWTNDVTDYPPNAMWWNPLTDPDHIAYQADPYQIWPDSHTYEITNMMVQSYAPAKAYWGCWYCHPGQEGTGSASNYKNATIFHAPGHGTPVESGCTQCHGPNLDGVNGFAIACTWCHQKQWSGVGGGLPMDHYNWDFEGFWDVGSELKGGPSEAEGGVWHRYGWADPNSVYPQNGYGGDGCRRCHGSDLAGSTGPDINGDAGAGDGFAPSCYSCHGPDGIGPPTHHDQPKGPVPYYHKQGYMDPTGAGGCTECHGADLTGDGIAPSCFSCHATLGAGHDQDLSGTSHRPGYEDPFGEGGCTECHGPNLNDGQAKSCFTCHGARWEPHNFAGEPWLPEGKNHCHVCHLPPTYNGGNDSTPEWNHELPTSVYTTFAYADQPTGVSLKCMGCHEGLPDGPAVDEFGDAPTQTYYVSGEEAFGTDLTQHHPISFTYDDQHGGLNDPSGTPSGLTPNGTVDQDMLIAGNVECLTCHNQHDNSKGNYLFETASEGLCFKCHKFYADPLTHHIPGRDDPWGDLREIAFNCTMCHGPDLAGDGLIPACTDCHNDFDQADVTPPLGHHGGDRTRPYFDCAVCHADPLTGIVTGNNFGVAWAKSCFQCHDDLWNLGGNDPPSDPAVAGTEDELIDSYDPGAGTIATLHGTVGEALTFEALVTDAEGDPIAYEWFFGDGSEPDLPSHDPIKTHTYNDYDTYDAVLAVTDGVNPPKYFQFRVAIGDTVEEVDGSW